MKFTALKNRNVFIDDVLDGKASYDDLNEYFEQWHKGGGYGVEVYEYLGLTWEQYAKWAGDDDAFKPEFDNLIKELKIARKISGV
jgi:hypothetical protein